MLEMMAKINNGNTHIPLPSICLNVDGMFILLLQFQTAKNVNRYAQTISKVK